jgi:hypothetical protein
MKKIYVLKQQNKHVSVIHAKRHYVIGFQNVLTARKVQYSLHPDPKMILLRDTIVSLKDDLDKQGYDLNLKLDVRATLFIPKCKGSVLHPLNDAHYHCDSHTFSEFLYLPLKNNIGIVMPYSLEEEDEDEFMFRSCVIDPLH